MRAEHILSGPYSYDGFNWRPLGSEAASHAVAISDTRTVRAIINSSIPKSRHFFTSYDCGPP